MKMYSKEIAKLAGVSRSTVSRVINNYSNVTPETKEKVNKVIKKYGTALGLDANEWSLEDGSGLSHNNRVSSNELSQLLLKVMKEPIFNEFYDSLPVGGLKERLEGGSLRKRFNTEPYIERVIAKTGSISGVYTLAGYIKAKSGQTYTFAIMTQNQPTPTVSSIDQVVKYIINSY